MKAFLKSFYLKLSVIFLLLLILMSVAQFLVTRQASNEFYNRADQTMNSNLAKNLVVDFKPVLKDSINMPEIEHMMHYMMVINPNIEIYLLDEAGGIMAFFAEPYKKIVHESVPLDPIHRFINQDAPMPIMGEDPRHEATQKVFSAARITLPDNSQGYLYVIIGSEYFDTVAETIWGDFLSETIRYSLLVSFVITAIVGLLLFALVTRRLRIMTDVVHDFASGKFNERIPAARQDEIGILEGSFNQLADTIVANMDELKKTDRIRRELIANISHDLRNPIASIKGYLETIQLKNKDLTPEERLKYVDSTLNVSIKMEELVEKLFELSKLDAKQVEPVMEPFALPDLIQDVIMKFTPIAEKKSVALLAELPELLPQVYGDIGLIERALSNLIDNAIQYTETGGTVAIGAKRADRQISVMVSDTGKGISEEELPLIFDRFYRVEKSRSKATGGAGLGLAITKKIIDLHASTLGVESQIDKGTTFHFSLMTSQTA
jgi:signal transduction histidine kinase